MLDMRGKKKKTTWEKWAARDWLPRSTLCATRHGHPSGLTISNMCRRRQRKVYPTEQALKKAILSMLPKSYRNAEITIREWNFIYGETNGYLATVRIFEENIDSICITKHSNGWSLRHGEDSIRSFTKELMVGINNVLLSFKDVYDIKQGFVSGEN